MSKKFSIFIYESETDCRLKTKENDSSFHPYPPISLPQCKMTMTIHSLSNGCQLSSWYDKAATKLRQSHNSKVNIRYTFSSLLTQEHTRHSVIDSDKVRNNKIRVLAVWCYLPTTVHQKTSFIWKTGPSECSMCITRRQKTQRNVSLVHHVYKRSFRSGFFQFVFGLRLHVINTTILNRDLYNTVLQIFIYLNISRMSLGNNIYHEAKVWKRWKKWEAKDKFL